MKTIGALMGLASSRRRRQNIRTLIWMLLFLIGMIVVFSVLFHQLMAAENRSYSWPTSIYWTVTTMSTLGFGDITFQSDLGRVFSMVVLVSGALVLLILLPFAVIEFIFAPWMDHREAARTPRRLPDDISGHIVVTNIDPVTQTLIARAKRSNVPHVVIVEDPTEATTLQDIGYRTLVGPLDSLTTYVNAGVQRAVMVVATQADTANTNVAFTVREADKKVVVATTADKEASVDVLQLAGADHVIQLASTLGTAMARRALSTSGRTHIVGQFGPTRIAEASARGTNLPGQLVDVIAELSNGPKLLAISQRGKPDISRRGTVITDQSVLVLAGTDEQLAHYDRQFAAPPRTDEGTALILGGGRVGRAAADILTTSGRHYSIVEQDPEHADLSQHATVGDAADLEVLRAAGLETATDVLVTTHDDDVNVYLALYCRRLKPDLQIVARATHERNVSTLYRAGADGVLSYAAIGATTIWNALGIGQRAVVIEGLEIFLTPVPQNLIGHTLSEVDDAIGFTGCHVVGVADETGALMDTAEEISADPWARLMVIGNRHDERRFRQLLFKKTPGKKTAAGHGVSQ